MPNENENENLQLSDVPLLLLDVTLIKIGDRVRQLAGGQSKKGRPKGSSSSIRDMANSLMANGQLQPIVIDGDRKLVAGFRRLVGCAALASEGKCIGFDLPDEIDGVSNPRKLPPGKILAVQYENLSLEDRLKIEMEENVQRVNFTDPEKAMGYARLKKLLEEKSGGPVSNREVAKAAKVSRAQVTMGLKVAEAVEAGSTHLLQASSVIAAYNQLNSENKIAELKARAADKPLAKTGEKPKEKVDDLSQRLYNGDTVEWIHSLPDSSVDFINFDPPWGIDIDDYDRWQNYEEFDDSTKVAYEKIILPLIPELYRVLKPDTYMVVWFGIQFYERLYRALESLSGTVKPKEDPKHERRFKVNPVPHIWYKTNKKGSQSDPTRIELNVYEPFFKVQKGNPRMFKHAQNNVLPFPMPTARIHYTQKDVGLQVDILERYSFGTMLCLDPTFGSGSFFRACQRLGREFIGAEQNTENYNKALEWLRLPV